MRTCGQSETPAWLNVHRGSAASGRFDDHLRNAAISLQKLPVPQIVLTRFSAHGLGRMLEKSPDYTIFRRNVGSSGKLAARGAVCDIALIARRRQKNGRRVECRGPGYTARAISRSAFEKAIIIHCGASRLATRRGSTPTRRRPRSPRTCNRQMPARLMSAMAILRHTVTEPRSWEARAQRFPWLCHR